MMSRKSMIIAAVVIGVMGVVGGMVWSAEKGKNKSVEATQDIVAMATSAKITIEEAMKTALENFPGKVIEVELEKKQGKTAWEVEILTSEQGIMKVYVDADSGSVMTTEEKTAGKEPAQETKS